MITAGTPQIYIFCHTYLFIIFVHNNFNRLLNPYPQVVKRSHRFCFLGNGGTASMPSSSPSSSSTVLPVPEDTEAAARVVDAAARVADADVLLSSLNLSMRRTKRRAAARSSSSCPPILMLES